jgi:GTP cyclohydrolase I
MPERVSWDEAVDAVKTLIRYIGDDPNREDLKDTPSRFLTAWVADWGIGYHASEPDMRTFNKDRYNEMVLQRGIHFYSHCEHHLCPFYGTVDIAYLPAQAGIVGLSKLARAVSFFARRLQTQERMVAQIADFLVEKIGPDVAVVAHGYHMCMITRGVQQHETVTTTSALRGEFFEKSTLRAEFTALLHPGR